MKTLTEQAKKEYITRGRPLSLPAALGTIKGGFVNIEAATAWRKVMCLSCGEAWNDLYTLTVVEEVP